MASVISGQTPAHCSCNQWAKTMTTPRGRRKPPPAKTKNSVGRGHGFRGSTRILFKGKTLTKTARPAALAQWFYSYAEADKQQQRCDDRLRQLNNSSDTSRDLNFINSTCYMHLLTNRNQLLKEMLRDLCHEHLLLLSLLGLQCDCDFCHSLPLSEDF